MPVRHWLVAIASGAIVAFGAQAAWAHSEAGGEQTTAPTVIRDVTTSLANTLGGRLDQVTGNRTFNNSAMTTNLTAGQSGRSGASSLKDTALWANFGYTSLKNDFSSTAYDGHLVNGMVGIDTSPIDPLTVGIAFGYENLDLDTTFNRGTQEWNGYTVSPYAVYRFLRNYSIDATIAYSWLDTDVTRIGTTGAASGNYDSDRWIGAVNLNGNWEIDRWRLGASIGYLYVRQDDDAYVETGPGAGAVPGLRTRIGQGRAGARLGYDFGTFEPYAKVRVDHEFVAPDTPFVGAGLAIPSNDRTGVMIGLGTLFKLDSRWSGGVEASTIQARDDQEIWGITGTIRFKF